MSEIARTAAELDALPVTATVLWRHNGRMWQKWNTIGGPAWFSGKLVRSAEFVARHPAEVLYRPDEPQRINPAEWCDCGHHLSAHRPTGECNPCGAVGVGEDAYPGCAQFVRLTADEPQRVQPSREAVWKSVVSGWREDFDEHGPFFDSAAAADAVLALLPGRSVAEVKAEALREAADATLRDEEAWSYRGDTYASVPWLRARADRIEADHG